MNIVESSFFYLCFVMPANRFIATRDGSFDYSSYHLSFVRRHAKRATNTRDIRDVGPTEPGKPLRRR